MKDRWKYTGLGQVSYGHVESYQQPMAWLDEVGGIIEDWGCGCCAAKQYVKQSQYIGIDGSHNEYSNVIDDLTEYRSQVHCILLRDVLDHNPEWEKVLQNALASFTRRMVVIIFRECGPKTQVVFVNDSPKYPGVPDYQFRAGDLMKFMWPYLVKVDRIENETLFYLERE